MIFYFLLLFSSAFASESEALTENQVPPALPIADKIHGTLSEQLIFISDRIDNFFVEERMEHEGSRSRVVLSYLVTFTESEQPLSEYLIRARLNFPKTQRKLKLVVESSVGLDNEAVDGEVSRDLINAEDNAQYSTALQFVFTESELWRVSTSAGMRFSTPLDPFVRLRLRRHFFNQEWIFRIIETLFWYELEGFGESTEFNAERKLNDEFYFKSASKLAASEDNSDVSFTQKFSVFQRLQDKKAMAYSIGMESNVNHPATVSRYYTNVAFRHNFYKEWAFYEIVPELSFPRDDGYQASASILFALDIVFGKY